MRPTLAQARALLGAPWAWRRNANSVLAARLYAGLMLLLMSLSAVAALWWFPARLAAIALAVLGGVILLVGWGWQFAALLRLDHPHAARLVPGHSQALRRTALGLWLWLMLLCGGLAQLAVWSLGARWHWPVFAVGAGAAMLMVALAMRWWWLWVLLWLVPLLNSLPGVGPLYRATVAWGQQHWSAEPVVSPVIALLTMALALAALFGHGNAAHLRSYTALERMRRNIRAGATGQKPTLAAYGRWGEVVGAPWQRLHDAWLARVTRRAQPTPASVMTRAEVVLQGAQHWVRHLGVMVPLLLGLVILFSVLAWRGTVSVEQLFSNGHVGMSIGLMSMALSPLINLPAALWVSRREQALLMLLPGLPRGAVLNRAVAWRQARQLLLMWLLTLPAFAALAWLAQAPYVLAFPVVVLAMLPWLWRNVARLGQPHGLVGALPFMLALATGMASMLLLRSYPQALWPWLIVMLGVTLGVGCWRWQLLMRWPACLPAGRLSN